jgi:hypothetical protein
VLPAGTFVKLGVAVGVHVALGANVCVAFGVPLSTGLAVPVAVSVGVGLALCVAVAVGVPVPVAVQLGLGLGVWVSVLPGGTGENVGVGVGAVFTPIAVAFTRPAVTATTCGELPVVTTGDAGSPGPPRFTLTVTGPTGTNRLKLPDASVTTVCVTPCESYSSTCTPARFASLSCSPLLFTSSHTWPASAPTWLVAVGVGVGRGVAVSLAVGVDVGWTVQVPVAEGVALGLAVALWVCVAVGLEDRVGVGVSAPTTPNQLVDVGWSATIVTVCGWLPVVTDGAYGSPGPARFTLSTAGPAGTSRLKNPNASVTAVCVTPQPGEYTNTCTFGRLGWLPCTPLRS